MDQPAHQRIFVVDDDEDDQLLIRLVLTQHLPTALIDVLPDGEALLEALSQAPALPDLVLLDLNMPRMGGLETLQYIRSHQTYAGLPIIVLTTSDNEADQAQAKAFQADGYLVKPPTVAQLNQLILTLKQEWL